MGENEVQWMRKWTYRARIQRRGTSTEAMTTRSAWTLRRARDLNRTLIAM